MGVDQGAPRVTAAAACGLILVGCGGAPTRPAETEPSPDIYAGWRVFQQRCAVCHGPDAIGGPHGAPALPARVRELGPRRFVTLVLQRYQWTMPAGQGGSESAAREAFVDEVLRRQDEGFAMPAWQGEPSVMAHIGDLYAYLASRGDSIGNGRPDRARDE
jgi:mono/diheme cytochrome c family protein